MEDHAVVEGGCLKARDARHQTLAPAAVTGDQVVNNLAGEDDAVRLPDPAIDPHFVAEARSPDMHQPSGIPAIVIVGPYAVIDGVADDLASFGFGLAPVDAQGKRDEDVVVGDTCLGQLLKQGLQHQVGAGQPCDVVDDDGYAFARLDDLAQAAGTDWRGESFADDSQLVVFIRRFRAARCPHSWLQQVRLDVKRPTG